MTATTEPPPRIATLDIVRGVAVMGILAMNIVAFAMPFAAYMNPLAYGMDGPADMASWALSFVFIDGKMRGLFSFLFGASLLLVIERAESGGRPAASIHYRRMLWLLVFGLLHFYFIWYGDILVSYALIGLIAWFFRALSTRKLIIWGIILVIVQFLLLLSFGLGAMMLQSAVPAGNAPADAVAQWQDLQNMFGVPSDQVLTEKMAMFRGPYQGLVEDRLIERGTEPLTGIMTFGWETLAYMLFGMAALKSGFFGGAWTGARYRKWAVIGFVIAIPAYALLAWLVARDGFTVPMVLSLGLAATVPFRPVMVVAIAALIILLTRNGGALTERISAAGRAAFTNYLGTSIIMTTLFYGYGAGLFGALSRIELWIVVIAMWALMLLWSKPWLDRFQYGPFEWLWRSLARWSWQPMRNSAPAAA